MVLTKAFVAEKVPALDFQIFFTRLPFLSVTSLDSAVISIFASLNWVSTYCGIPVPLSSA
ncbi:MAG: hypothetical protein ACLRMG_00165 [Clostridium sp.]